MKRSIQLAIESALKDLALFDPSIPVAVEIPQNLQHGDYATNVVFLYAKEKRQNPSDLAMKIAAKIREDNTALFSRVEVARPAFINFTLSRDELNRQLMQIALQRDKYGQGQALEGKRILLEFVSANPTGPLHIGHGRWAVLGDNLAALLIAQGAKVEREFYINDVGRQIELLVSSVKACLEDHPIPEDGYHGAYIKDLAEEAAKNKTEKPALAGFILQKMLDSQKRVLLQMGVSFDRWFSEATLHAAGEVRVAADRLTQAGITEIKEHALWFKSSLYGDDKDRVLIKEDGAFTYFTADIAYHLNKLNRGYDLLINIWGTDHHGYVARLKAALRALGQEEQKLKIIIGQLVSLYRGKEQVRMSKRSGEMITLGEVIEEIGPDASRFFLSMTDEHAHLDFDLELAKEKSEENPVYYVQYAHARICSIFRQPDPRRPVVIDAQKASLSLLKEEAEVKLVKKLISFPDVLSEAAIAYEPHRLVTFVREAAALFHNFYHQCRVISDEPELTLARLVLVDATRVIIANVLKLLSISAPERM